MCSIMGYLGSGITLQEFKKGFDETTSRGPDSSAVVTLNNGIMGFHRLSIMGLTDSGMQPFSLEEKKVV